MNETPNERHRRLVNRFVMSLVPVLEQPKKVALGEMMVIVESVELGIMQILNQLFEMPPAECVEMMEQCLHQATERFSKHQNKEKK